MSSSKDSQKTLLRTLAASALVVGFALVSPGLASAQGEHYGYGDNFSRYSGAGFTLHQGANGESDVNVCAQNEGAGSAACDARVVVQPSARTASTVTPTATNTASCPAGDVNAPAAVVTGGNGGYDPCYLQSAYNAAAQAEANGGRGQIVAIVDYSVDSKIASDLATYRAEFGLPTCPTGTVSPSNTSCVFQQVAQSRAPSSGSSGWDVEISLDVDAVSAICPNCQILLVEANSASYSALGSAVNTAVADGAIAVSNSYGGSESSSENATATSYYQHPGVAITVSSGDTAGVVEFPAAAPDVVAVGGTSLLQYSDGGTRSANATESVWDNTPAAGDGSGAGCSAYEAAPTWQSTFITNAGGAATCAKRVTADVSADADPNTGLWIYDTLTQGGWLIVGGTSLASPITAALYGLQNNATGSSVYPASLLYADAGSFYHVTSGNVGTCGNYLCDATKSINGFNGPTGVGTPGGPTALSAYAFSTPTAPATPAAPSIGTVTSNSVALSWPAVPGATSYNVDENGTSIATNVTATSYTVTGLAPSTAYSFTIQAVNTVGSSAFSTASSATTYAALAPNAPTNVVATAGNASITLSWTASTVPSGAATVTSYTVSYATTSGGESSGTHLTGITGTSTTITSLTNGTRYYVTVTATNGIASAPSTEVAATPVAPPTKPSAPSSVQASASGTSVTITWTASTGTAPITYVVLRSTSRSMSNATSSGATTSPYTVTGLSTSTTYYFEVQATNAGGTSTSSVVSSRG